MKLAVNIHCLHPPMSGIGRYANHLLLELFDKPQIEAVAGISHVGWHPQGEVESIVRGGLGYELPSPKTVGRVKRALSKVIPGIGHAGAWLNHRLSLRTQALYRDYVYWEPNYLLLPVANPALVTLHDLSHLRYPQCHPPARIRELSRLSESVSKADSILTVSNFTRTEIAHQYGIPHAEIHIVPPAVSGSFVQYSDDQHALIKERYNLPEKFLLFAGTLEPRKNLLRLLKAYTLLPASYRDEYPLVLCGREGWHGDELQQAINTMAERHIRRLGYVGAEDLPRLVSAATAMVYPSLYEGFGMPILEAMAAGTPVLTSNVASMPEVAGGAAKLVDPLSIEEIQRGLRQLMDGECREQMVEKGLKVASGYSWKRSAELLADRLLHVAAGKHHGG